MKNSCCQEISYTSIGPVVVVAVVVGAAVVVVVTGEGEGLEVDGVVQAYVTTLNISNKTTVIVGKMREKLSQDINK